MLKRIKLRKEKPTAARRVDLESLLCEAICSRKRIYLRYQNEFQRRTFEPYIVYQLPTGKIIVHGMQTKDDSNPAQGKSLRSFEVGLLSSVILIEELFEHEDFFAPPETEIGMKVICSIN